MLKPLLRKELKELLMERSILIGIIIVPLIMFPLIGGLTSFGVRSAVTQVAGVQEIGLVDRDNTDLSEVLLPATLRDNGLKPIILECRERDECVRIAEDKNLKLVAIIPSGFSENFTRGLRGRVETIYILRSLSFSEITACEKLSSKLARSLKSLAERIHGRGLNLEFLKHPADERSTIIYLGRSLEAPIEALASMLPTMILGLPLVAVMVSSYASSISATSIALEKESKTLELLLSLPVRRFTILLSKLLGTLIIVILGTISFMVGFAIYGFMLASAFIPEAGAKTDVGGAVQTPFIGSLLTPSPIFMAVVLASIFLGMIMTTCLGILIGVLCADVRSSQQLVGAVVTPLTIFPFFILIFSSIENLPAGIRIALLLDPYTHLFLAIMKGFVGDLPSATLSLAVMAGATAAMLAIGSWLFMGERLITMRIGLKRKSI
ncbi:MAG: hypothetical protein B6U65_04345 [Candidatus Wolframiiraptor sp. EX4484-121]|nr:MAG: hypothetical protein B6U65_04345 [Candidatus Wolframiiraptor sp. EX4484-121]